ncbi:MAG TPA: cation:proton antiporter [Egibacteraceae bacterium]|nr:cation:proton antiporter [Egibacteraceae bacterium]
MTFTLLLVAGLGAFALLVGKIAKRFVPEIVVFLALGLLIGPDGPFRLINGGNIRSLNLVTQVALAAIIFLIGDRMRLDELRGARHVLLPLNAAQMIATGAVVFFATRWAGADARAALVLALIAAETGVLTITATVSESRAAGAFTDLLVASVGVTNVVTAAVFGLAFPFVLASTGDSGSVLDTAAVFGQIVLASTVIGLAGGWLLRTFGRMFETSGELLLFLLIVVTGIAGASIAVSGSVVVSALIAGLYVANTSPWMADRLFAAIRVLEAPIYLVFFVVAGASIHLGELAAVGAIGAAYILARGLGKVGGSALGGALSMSGRDAKVGLRTGLALLPHAGMAIALVAFVVEQSPVLGESVSPVVLGSVIVFELSGPLFARRALRASGEAGTASRAHATPLPELVTARTFRKVLIPVGNVEVRLPRLAFLLDLVTNIGADLVVVHVSQPGTGLRSHEEPDVLRLVRRIAQERNVACRAVHVESERIAAEIVRVSEEESADLIIMGEPVRMSLLEPSRWGLVAQRVVGEASMPVLVYPVDPSDPQHVPSAYLRKASKAVSADAKAGNAPAEEPADGDEPTAAGSAIHEDSAAAEKEEAPQLGRRSSPPA